MSNRWFCHRTGGDEENMRGKGFGLEQYYPTRSQKTRRMGHPIFCGWGEVVWGAAVAGAGLWVCHILRLA
jgi:hypothetical protein